MWLFAASALLIIIVAGFIFYASRQRRNRIMREMEFSRLRADTERRLTRRYIEGLESERERMSRELHDGVCNDLLAIQMNMRNSSIDIATTEALIGSCRDSVRRISHELMPPEFTYANIDEVIRYHVYKLRDAGSDILYHSEISGAQWDSVPDHVALEVYRIIQEAVGNALKHSGNGHICVEISLINDILSASVSDSGHYNSSSKRGIGLSSMKHRANAIDAALNLFFHDSGGSKVALSVKIQPSHSKNHGNP